MSAVRASSVRVAVAVASVASSGCVFMSTNLDTNAPQDVKLEGAPAALYQPQRSVEAAGARVHPSVDVGADPGMRGWVATASGFVGPSLVDDHGEAGLELGLHRFTAAKTSNYTLDALGQKLVFRPSVGWHAIRFSSSSFHEDRTGHVFGEAAAIYRVSSDLLFLRAGLGLAYDAPTAAIGPQGTVCATVHPVAMDLCWRSNVFSDRGYEGAILFVFSSFFVRGESR